MRHLLLPIMLLIVISCRSQIPPNVPTTGLVGYWPLDNTLATDLTVNANHGTVHSATATTDRFNSANKALDFNGLTDYVLVPDAPSLSGFNDLSLSVWL